MRKYSLILALVASAVLLALASWYVVRTLEVAPDAPIATNQVAQMQPVQVVNGETVVIVAPDVQRSGDISVEILSASTFARESTAYATVIDLQPLFDLRSRLIATRADRDGAQAQADTFRAQYERNRTLFKDNQNISQKSLQDARAAMKTSQAKLQSAEAAQSELEAAIKRQFGDALAHAATKHESDLFQQLSAGHTVVLRVAFPASHDTSAPAQITIDGFDNQTVSANKLSVSPQVDPLVQGRPFFYSTKSALPVGAHTTAHAPLARASVAGVLIPESAIIWYGGQPWAYVQTSADHFTRRYVKSAWAVEGGVVVTDGFRAGDKVVIRGAQLLLSKELHPQGIATQCKDPPECDG